MFLKANAGAENQRATTPQHCCMCTARLLDISEPVKKGISESQAKPQAQYFMQKCLQAKTRHELLCDTTSLFITDLHGKAKSHE